ncbi:MAG: aminotransferase class I/II-fold pyridoxal phosphate-dependent enzyme, partial [Micromonosporaceae bacterium]|nr:aminotransferase class I/II-fold pyridoxal phosphate-dependent enzyme [Micromonosporaceae bacterium]
MSRETVRSLIEEQSPEWRRLPLRRIASQGTVNAIFGDRCRAQLRPLWTVLRRLAQEAEDVMNHGDLPTGDLSVHNGRLLGYWMPAGRPAAILAAMAAQRVRGPLAGITWEQARERHSVKWRMYEPDVLPLWVAEMDVALAPPIRAALADAVARGDTGYAHLGRLGEAFAGFAARRYGWAPDPGRMALVPDVLAGIDAVLRLVSEPGEGVLVNTPAYPPFFAVVAGTGRRLVESPLAGSARDGYRLDLDRLERDLSRPEVTVYLLCHPHNPTGLVLTRDELCTVATLATRHRVRLLVDEIHAPLTYPPARHVAIGSIVEDAAQAAVVFASASKAWNLPGLKAALVVAAGEPAGQTVSRLPPELGPGASLFGVLAGEAAFTEGEAWLDALLADLDVQRHHLADLLAGKLPEVGYHMPEATFLAWLDLRGLDPGGLDPGGLDPGGLDLRG